MAPWWAAALMIVLSLPALRVGFVADDYYHRAILEGRGALSAVDEPLWDLFVFVPGDARAELLRDVGIVPWWGHPDLHLAFMRPLTSATHIIDNRLWPNDPVPQHVQSLLWFGAAVVLVGIVYRRVHGATAVAGLAVLLFAVEDAHAMSIGWIANRNAVVGLVFGLLALWAHIQWRRHGGPIRFAAALISFAVGLLAGEAVVGTAAYLVSWQLTMDEGRWPRRMMVLMPYVVLLAGWRVVYKVLGYGCAGSDLHIDPVVEPLTFAAALIERAPVMFAGLWSQLTTDVWATLNRPGQLVLCAFSVVVCAFVAALSVRLIRANRRARFWAIGAVLSLVPVAAAFPMNRLLLVSGIGAFGLLAMLADDVGILGGAAGDVRLWVRRSVKALLVLHIPLASVLLVASILFLSVFNTIFTAGARGAPRDPDLATQDLIFLNGHEFPSVYTYVIRLTDDDTPAPRRVAILGPMSTAVTVTREGENTLVLAAEDGWLRSPIDQLMRSTDAPVHVGERIRTVLFDAEIRQASSDGRPVVVSFEFRRPLDRPSFRWVAWRGGRLEEVTPPGVGGEIRLSSVPLVTLR